MTNHDPDREALKDLNARLGAVGVTPEKSKVIKGRASVGASRIGFDFVGSVLGGALLGGIADREFNSGPWLFLIMLFLGFGVGTYNMWKALQEKPSNTL